MKENAALFAILLVAVFGAAAAHAAGQVEVATSSGGGVNTPMGGCGAEDDGPVNCVDTADVGMGDPEMGVCILDLQGGDYGGDQTPQPAPVFDCEEEGGGDAYIVETLYDEDDLVIGLLISRVDGAEPTALCFREKTAEIASVRVKLPLIDRVARIKKVDPGLTLAGGFVDIELNGQAFAFSTRALRLNATALNVEIGSALTRGGFEVRDTGDYWVIVKDPSGMGIHDVRFASSDTMITESHVSLEPDTPYNFPYCFPPPPPEV